MAFPMLDTEFSRCSVTLLGANLILPMSNVIFFLGNEEEHINSFVLDEEGQRTTHVCYSSFLPLDTSNRVGKESSCSTEQK